MVSVRPFVVQLRALRGRFDPYVGRPALLIQSTRVSPQPYPRHVHACLRSLKPSAPDTPNHNYRLCFGPVSVCRCVSWTAHCALGVCGVSRQRLRSDCRTLVRASTQATVPASGAGAAPGPSPPQQQQQPSGGKPRHVHAWVGAVGCNSGSNSREVGGQGAQTIVAPKSWPEPAAQSSEVDQQRGRRRCVLRRVADSARSLSC